MLGPVLGRRRIDVHAAHGILGDKSWNLVGRVIAAAFTPVSMLVGLVAVLAHDPLTALSALTP